MMITLQKDRYETLGHLGSGATSRVEKARDNVIGRIVARKTFLNGFGEDHEQQFLREAQIIGQLSDPCITASRRIASIVGGPFTSRIRVSAWKRKVWRKFDLTWQTRWPSM